jgi:hypothetical protein
MPRNEVPLRLVREQQVWALQVAVDDDLQSEPPTTNTPQPPCVSVSEPVSQ